MSKRLATFFYGKVCAVDRNGRSARDDFSRAVRKAERNFGGENVFGRLRAFAVRKVGCRSRIVGHFGFGAGVVAESVGKKVTFVGEVLRYVELARSTRVVVFVAVVDSARVVVSGVNAVEVGSDDV